MKYLVLIPDGAADLPIPELGGKTPFEAACKPTLDALAAVSTVGTVSNVPSNMVPESDTANLAILSYDPAVYSKGRSPLEAMSLGLAMDPDDTAIRCNVVTLSDDDGTGYENRTMIDHSADEITTEEADELVRALNEALPMEGRVLHTGVSYRHCLIWKGAAEKYNFMRPHDILGQKITEHLPKISDVREVCVPRTPRGSGAPDVSLHSPHSVRSGESAPRSYPQLTSLRVSESARAAT